MILEGLDGWRWPLLSGALVPSPELSLLLLQYRQSTNWIEHRIAFVSHLLG